MARIVLWAALVSLVGPAAPLFAQSELKSEPQTYSQSRGADLLLGASFVVGRGTGYFGGIVGSSVASSLGVQVAVTPRGGPLGIRIECTDFDYGDETRRVPLDDPSQLSGELTIYNSITNCSVGPLLLRPSGRLRHYAYVMAGHSWFDTGTQTQDLNDCDTDSGTCTTVAQQTIYSQKTLSWTVGGGVLVRLSRSSSLDFGVRYVGNKPVNWLAKGDLVEDANGFAAPAQPRRSSVNLVEFTLGYAFGLHLGH